jgi:hypothetical protein
LAGFVAYEVEPPWHHQYCEEGACDPYGVSPAVVDAESNMSKTNVVDLINMACVLS